MFREADFQQWKKMFALQKKKGKIKKSEDVCAPANLWQSFTIWRAFPSLTGNNLNLYCSDAPWNTKTTQFLRFWSKVFPPGFLGAALGS